MNQRQTVLVLGATGGIGGEMASALLRRDWTVRGLHRSPDEAARRSPWLKGVEWVRGDAMRPEDVIGAADGAALIVHAVNPPHYRRWGELVLPMLESSIRAAQASRARILLPGTIYNYGPDVYPVLTETSPQHPRTRKGAIRVEMEQRLRAAQTVGVRTLIVRAGDFFGPRPGGSWFSQGLIKPGELLRSISRLGSKGVGHAWAYLPDVAEAMAQLLERDAALGAFETFHFAGHWDPDGTAMVAAIRRAAENPALRVRPFPWPIIAAASPFMSLCRELWEVRHLWREPLQLDNTRLVDALGAEPRTPLDIAVRDTLARLGCLREQNGTTTLKKAPQ